MKEKFKEVLEKFLTNSKGCCYLPFIPFMEAVDILTELGFVDCDDYEVNGRDVDFWNHFTKDNVKYMFSGSFWYGKYVFEVDTDGADYDSELLTKMGR